MATNVFTETWSTGIWGTSIGLSNLLLEDLTGDGTPEIIAGAAWGASFWYVAGYDASTQEYEQIWISGPLETGTISRIVVDEFADAPRVLVATSTGELQVYSGWPLALDTVATIPSAATGLISADLDGDGHNELVVSTATSLHVLNGETFASLWSTTYYGAQDIDVGQVDGDAALEIVTNNGRVVDGVSHAVQWNYTPGFGANVEVGNIDADAVQEIVGAASWYYVTAFDAIAQSPLWQINTIHDVGAMEVQDVDGDGVDEILVGDGQWGSVSVHDSATREVIASISNPEHGVTDISLGDVDADEALEILWGAGHTSSGRDILAVGDLATETIEWSSTQLDGPLAQLAFGDVDADGSDELVVATFESDRAATTAESSRCTTPPRTNSSGAAPRWRTTTPGPACTTSALPTSTPTPSSKS